MAVDIDKLFRVVAVLIVGVVIGGLSFVAFCAVALLKMTGFL